MLGEIRNYSAFYMTQSDFDKYLKFFQYLDGKSEFSFKDFQTAFSDFKKWINGEHLSAVDYIRDPEALIQLFYDVNLIGYRENVGDGGVHYHFAYRERTLTNVSPQVKLTGNLMINPGVGKALDIGLRAKSSNAATREKQEQRKRHKKKKPQNSPPNSPPPAVTTRTIEAATESPEVVKRRRKRRRKNRTTGTGDSPDATS